jgi:hypothetical protein
MYYGENLLKESFGLSFSEELQTVLPTLGQHVLLYSQIVDLTNVT